METKFKKVMTSERIPETESFYFVKKKGMSENSGYYFIPTNRWNVEQFKDDIECWYEEYECREEQLTILLQDAINLINELPHDSKLQETRGNLCMNAQSLIFEIKNNAPNILD
jgi:hypothetical protein